LPVRGHSNGPVEVHVCAGVPLRNPSLTANTIYGRPFDLHARAPALKGRYTPHPLGKHNEVILFDLTDTLAL